MGVYIKGIEMPTNDTVLLRIYPKGELNEFYVEQLAIDEDTIGEYWAVELPPHGRLIDAEKIYDAVEQRYRMSSGIEHRCERDLLDLICAAPTIIPAEEDE